MSDISTIPKNEALSGKDKKLLLIDNYDSFTYNLVQYFQTLGVEVMVKRNDEISVEEAEVLNPDFLVFSPGPGTVENPKDIGVGPELFEAFRGRIPILGVCLGHQMMGHIFGGTIKKVSPVHGKRWPTKIISPTGIFEGFPEEIETMRYHSMVVAFDEGETHSYASLQITAEFMEPNGENLMAAFEKADEKIFGVQFHPESIGTKTGMRILENFLDQ